MSSRNNILDTMELSEIREYLNDMDNMNSDDLSIDSIIDEVNAQTPKQKSGVRQQKNQVRAVRAPLGSMAARTGFDNTCEVAGFTSDTVRVSIRPADDNTAKLQRPLHNIGNADRILKSAKENACLSAKSRMQGECVNQNTSAFVTGRLNNKGKWRDVIGDVSEIKNREEMEELGEDEEFAETQDEGKTLVNPRISTKSCARKAKSLKKRSKVFFMLWMVMCYLCFSWYGFDGFSLPLPQFLQMPNNYRYYVVSIIMLQIVSALFVIDVIISSLTSLFTEKIRIDAVVIIANIVVFIHCAIILLQSAESFYMPFSMVSFGALYFTVLSRKRYFESLANAYKACSMNEKPVGVFASGQDMRIFRKQNLEEGSEFLHQMSKPDVAQLLASVYVPIVLIFSLAISFYITLESKDVSLFVWCLSGLLCASVPFGMISGHSKAYLKATSILCKEGAALAACAQSSRLSKINAVVIDDIDLFPRGTVTIEGMKIFDNNSSEKILSYAAALLDEGGIPSNAVFYELLKQKYGRPVKASDVKHYDSGGIVGKINSDIVTLGSDAFMVRTGVRVSEKHRLKTGMYLAINKQLVAVFAIKYRVSPQTFNGVHLLSRLKTVKLLATRDFNLNPQMVEKIFDIKRGSLEYPPISMRLKLSQTSADDNIPYGIMARNNFSAYVCMLRVAKRLRTSTFAIYALGLIGSFFGMCVMSYFIYNGYYAEATCYNLLLYTTLWSVPIYIVSRGIKG